MVGGSGIEPLTPPCQGSGMPLDQARSGGVQKVLQTGWKLLDLQGRPASRLAKRFQQNQRLT